MPREGAGQARGVCAGLSPLCCPGWARGPAQVPGQSCSAGNGALLPNESQVGHTSPVRCGSSGFDQQSGLSVPRTLPSPTARPGHHFPFKATSHHWPGADGGSQGTGTPTPNTLQTPHSPAGRHPDTTNALHTRQGPSSQPRPWPPAASLDLLPAFQKSGLLWGLDPLGRLGAQTAPPDSPSIASPHSHSLSPPFSPSLFYLFLI